MIKQAFIPIFVPSGHSGSVSTDNLKILLAIWIIINVIWVISLLISGIKYLMSYFKNIDNPDRKFYWFTNHYNRWDSDFLIVIIFDIFMIFFWSLILLFKTGQYLANFI